MLFQNSPWSLPRVCDTLKQIHRSGIFRVTLTVRDIRYPVAGYLPCLKVIMPALLLHITVNSTCAARSSKDIRSDNSYVATGTAPSLHYYAKIVSSPTIVSSPIPVAQGQALRLYQTRCRLFRRPANVPQSPVCKSTSRTAAELPIASSTSVSINDPSYARLRGASESIPVATDALKTASSSPVMDSVLTNAFPAAPLIAPASAASFPFSTDA